MAIKLDGFTQRAREALETGQGALKKLHQSQLDTEHLLRLTVDYDAESGKLRIKPAAQG